MTTQTELPLTRDRLLDAFAAFHAANPGIWRLFERFTHEAIAGGRRHYSASAIAERIRWWAEIETKGDDFKLNNNHRAFFARMFHAKHPEHGDFFRNRQRDDADEAALLERLRDL